MIEFEWNKTRFSLIAVGGGTLYKDIAFHSHSANSYELHFILSGKGSLITKEKEYPLCASSFFLTGPNFYHAQKSDANDPVQDIYIYLQKTSQTKQKNIFSDTFLNQNFFFANSFDSTAAQQIFSEYKGKKADYKSAVSGLLCLLLTQITRLYLPESFREVSDSDNLYDRRFLIIENAFLYDKNITLSSLSEKIGLCPRQTQRLLNKYYGQSFRQKLRESKEADKN